MQSNRNMERSYRIVSYMISNDFASEANMNLPSVPTGQKNIKFNVNCDNLH